MGAAWRLEQPKNSVLYAWYIWHIMRRECWVLKVQLQFISSKSMPETRKKEWSHENTFIFIIAPQSSVLQIFIRPFFQTLNARCWWCKSRHLESILGSKIWHGNPPPSIHMKVGTHVVCHLLISHPPPPFHGDFADVYPRFSWIMLHLKRDPVSPWYRH